MRAYLSAKFEGDDNEETVRALCTAAERAGFIVTCTNRDFDDFGRNERDPEELLPYMQDAIEQSDVILIDITDPGVGLGIEAGYATALNKPVVVLAHDDTIISGTLTLLAKSILYYQGFDDLTKQLGVLKGALNRSQA